MMQVGGMSLDDDVEREHEESAEMRSSSTLALSSFKGSWCIGIFSICEDDRSLVLQWFRCGEVFTGGSDKSTLSEWRYLARIGSVWCLFLTLLFSLEEEVPAIGTWEFPGAMVHVGESWSALFAGRRYERCMSSFQLDFIVAIIEVGKVFKVPSKVAVIKAPHCLLRKNCAANAKVRQKPNSSPRMSFVKPSFHIGCLTPQTDSTHSTQTPARTSKLQSAASGGGGLLTGTVHHHICRSS